MYSREEVEDFIDDVAFDADLGNALEVAEKIAPGRQDVRAVLEDLHNTFIVDESVLEYYTDRLERILNR